MTNEVENMKEDRPSTFHDGLTDIDKNVTRACKEPTLVESLAYHAG